MKTTKIILLSSILAFASSAAFAAEVPKFKDIDADKSKSLDESEFQKATDAGVKKTFQELDKDKDGKLSINEYSILLDEDCE
jgi:Ca2+-binding EF-hand superfamily protein